MRKNDYKKLNEYLNDIVLFLEKKDSFFLKHLQFFDFITSEIRKVSKKYDDNSKLKDYYLTYEDVFLLAREIIASIDYEYLASFDSLIPSGRLDFSYNMEYFDSHFAFFSNKNSKNFQININREFNLNDVITLVHEFYHYTNFDMKHLSRNHNSYLLTEFISIYFELYATSYLQNKKEFSSQMINNHSRIKNCIERCRNIYNYNVIFQCFLYFGEVLPKNYSLLNEYIQMSKETFEWYCDGIFQFCLNQEKKYQEQIGSNRNWNYEDYVEQLGTFFSSDYRYVLGTILAYYAVDHCDIQKMVWFNHQLGSGFLDDMSFEECLEKIGICINNISIDSLLDPFKHRIESSHYSK